MGLMGEFFVLVGIICCIMFAYDGGKVAVNKAGDIVTKVKRNERVKQKKDKK